MLHSENSNATFKLFGELLRENEKKEAKRIVRLSPSGASDLEKIPLPEASYSLKPFHLANLKAWSLGAWRL